MSLKEMSNEELLDMFRNEIQNYVRGYEFVNIENARIELLSRLSAGQQAIAELKTAKLDSARLIHQEKANDDLRCCGNCKFYQSGTDCIEWNHWNQYCDNWQSDGLIKVEREAK